MHTQHLVPHATALLEQLLRFEQGAEAVLAQYAKAHRQLGARDRALLGDALYTVLRRMRSLDALAQRSGQPRLRALAELGLQACGAAPPPALAQVPPHGDLPDWLCERLRALRADGFEALALSLLQPAALDVRVNTLKLRRAQAQQALAAAGLASTPTPYSPWGLRLVGKPALQGIAVYAQGGIEVQDEGSQLLALLADARRGMMVADFCAGAGGKTLALGAAMRGTGRLYAFDTSAQRLAALAPRLARSGLDNVHTAAIAHENDARLAALAGKMDRVLVDAPCSGLGTLRRAPERKWRCTPQDVADYAAQQAAILAAAARLLRPGGRLVYATCSLLREENEDVALAFGAQHPDFRPILAADALGALRVPRPQALCSGPQGRWLRLYSDLHGTDCFFAALWQRR